MFDRLAYFGGFVNLPLNTSWHGINVLSILEFCLVAMLFCTILTLGFAVRRDRSRLISWALAGTMMFSTAALAANTALSGLTASGALAGANLIYVVQTVGSGGVKATMTQVATFINSLFSGDATVASGGAVTLATVNTNVGSFGSATSCTAFTTNGKGLITAASATTCTPAIASVTGLGTGVATALGTNVGTAGSFVVNGGALGTPSSGVATNLTGTAAGLTAGTVTTNANLTGMVTSVGNAASLGSFTSANLAGALTDETGTGVAVFGTAPTISSLNATTAMTLAFLTGGGTQCLQVSNTGVLSATGSACGSGGGITFPQTVAGTTSSGGIPYFSGATTLSSSAALAANALVIGGGAGVAPSTTTTGTGVLTLLGSASSGTGAPLGGTAPTMSSPTINTAMTLGFLTGAGTECMQVSNTGVVSGTGSACGGSGSTGANPTATGSDTAVNGVATTFMRSDAAPAIQKTSASLFGLAKVDNSTITASGGVISTVNNGTVTSVGAGCGTSTGGSAITATGNVLAAYTLRTNSTTSDPIVAADCGNQVNENNASSIAVSIAQAGTTGFAAGTFFQVCNVNAGVATITPTTSTIGGASTLVIQAGTASHPNCAAFQSDGTNYNLTSLVHASGVAAALGTAVGSAGSFVVNGGALGTPSSGTLTSATGLPISTGLTGTGTGVLGAMANNLSAASGLTSTIASGTAALGTGSISSAACATVVTVTATNVATTDTLTASFNGDPTAVTGYIPSTAGTLTIFTYPTSGNVNFKVCNSTASPVTPGAITLNWRVVR